MPMGDELWVGAGLGGFALLLFLLERCFPLRRPKRPLAGRLLVNLGFAGLAFVTVLLSVRPAALAMLGWTERSGFGLLQLPVVPDAVRAILAFLLLDLSFYWWHRANHRLALLWRFHSVHHIDPDLDVSTALRFHCVELAFSSAFRVVQIGLIAPSPWAYAAYELIFQTNTLFHHSNTRLPIRAERLLNRVLVTPRMHGIHHSQVRAETSANYASVFPWWDRLHRTLRLNIPQSAIEIGIPAYTRKQDNHPWHALVMPFRRQRRYWQREDGTAPRRDATAAGEDAGRLAA
jgi:sterol desaturase/sphingolipid hydroxylase (fatty acid hydroxylase superfamily)